MPDLSYEIACGVPVCGIDEAGRGPLAGPVVAAAVTLPSIDMDRLSFLSKANDSKALSPKLREELYQYITTHCDWSVGICDVNEIDTYNILQATLMAMTRAHQGLKQATAHALIDGNRAPLLHQCECQTIIKGDSLSLSIACASIMAKVTRDRIMQKLDKEFPQYGWARNAGYGTKDHIIALELFGPTPHHRQSFAPVRKARERQAA